MTYELAHDPQYEALMTTHSLVTGNKINRFCNIYKSIDDMIMKVKMVRLLGGDYFRAGMLESYLVDTDNDIRNMHEAATGDWSPRLPILPAVSGGLNPKTIGANVRALGPDNLLLAGTGILQHPDGPRAGVEALRQAANEALAAGGA